jgi:hypothetical protein
MQKKAIAGLSAIAAVVLLGAASSYFSPYWTIYQMKQAYDRRDAPAFSSYIDFPSVQASVKAQTQAKVRDTLNQRFPGKFLATLGAALASNVTDPVVDTLISPTGVAQAFANAGPDQAERADQVNRVDTPAAPTQLQTNPATTSAAAGRLPAAEADRQQHYLILYRDWSTVAASSPGRSAQTHAAKNPLWSPDNTFVFRRTGLWSWQLTAIEFPPGSIK